MNNRWIQNQKAKERQRNEFYGAQQALLEFRRDSDATNFPSLRRWVERHGSDIPRYNLDAFGHRDFDPRLTKEEYLQFKEAYEALPVIEEV